MNLTKYTITVTPKLINVLRKTEHSEERKITMSVLVDTCNKEGMSEIKYLLKDDATGIEAPLAGHLHIWWDMLDTRFMSKALAMTSRDIYKNRFIVTSDIKTSEVTITGDSFMYSSDKELVATFMHFIIDTIDVLSGLNAKRLESMAVAK